MMDNPPPYSVSAEPGSSKPYEKRLKIIVGLDYGTTNSGISYVTSDQTSADKIEVIRQWPNGPGIVCKVPSIIAYENENEDEISQDEWGYRVEGGVKAYLWTKLLLGKDARSSDASNTEMSEIYGQGLCTLPAGKTAKEVCTDYLRGLYKYLVERLQKHDDHTYRITPIEFWVTVPAMWTDGAKSATIEAAQAAGFGAREMDSIHIITEPEAAALTVLMPKVGFGSVMGLQDGPQNVLICDCGGGTVDIVTYKVSLQNGQLDFEELLVGVGSMCGSTFIDRNFNAWMTEKFGTAYTSVDMEMRGSSSNFFRQFEIAKRNFSGPNHDKNIDIWPINMKTSRSEHYIKRNFTVRLLNSDMLSLFDPPINQIIRLVESQVESARSKGDAINQIFLVGGFGDSPYLNSRLKEWCLPRNIRLNCPPSCQEAIVRGAALRGLAGLKPSKRLARRHYGYSTSQPFREGVDDEASGWIDEFNGTKLCRNRMTWFMAKGDSIDQYKKKTFPMLMTIYSNSSELVNLNEIWSCDRDTAPDSSQHWSMVRMGKVTMEFTMGEIQNSGTPKWSAKYNSWVYKIPYELEVDLFSERGDLQFKAIRNGVTRGNVNVQFEEHNDT